MNLPLYGRIYALHHIQSISLSEPFHLRTNSTKIKCFEDASKTKYEEDASKRKNVKDASKNVMKMRQKRNMRKMCHLGCCQKERQGKICRECQLEPATFKLKTANWKIVCLELKSEFVKS